MPKKAPPPHPIQPLLGKSPQFHFRPNAIVVYLLEHGGIDMCDLARLDFTREERAHFAQLIGYSLAGYSELDYVSDDDYRAAAEKAENGVSDEQARVTTLTDELTAIRTALREPMARLFGIHPDDLSQS